MAQDLSLNIAIGGHVNSTLGQAFKKAVSSTKKVGAAYRETNKRLKAADGVVKYTHQLAKLAGEQKAVGGGNEKLAQRIKKTQYRLEDAQREARHYALSLDRIGDEQKRLTRESERFNKTLERRRRLGQIGGALVGGARGTGRAGRAAKIAGLGALGVVGGTVATIASANRRTAVQEAQARAVGMDPGTHKALGAVVAESGLDPDSVTDIVEELNNKIGESAGLAELTPVKESLQILGLEFEKIKKLAPEDQFLSIARAAQELDDAQQASAAADILMGGEANKIIGYLRTRGESIDSLVEGYKKLNSVTDEGRAGARLFNIALNKLSVSSGSALGEVAGIIGTELSPVIEKWAKDLAAFFKENRPEVKKFITSLEPFFEKLPGRMQATAKAIGTIIRGLEKVASWIIEDDEEEEEKKQSSEKKSAKRLTQFHGGFLPYMTPGRTLKESGKKSTPAGKKSTPAGNPWMQFARQPAQHKSAPATPAQPVVNLSMTVHNAAGLNEKQVADMAANEVKKALHKNSTGAGIRARGSMLDEE